MKRQNQKITTTKSTSNGNKSNYYNNKGENLKDLQSGTTSRKTTDLFKKAQLFFFNTIAPLFLLCITPHFLVLLWFTATKCSGSYSVLFQYLTENGIYNGVVQMWLNIHIASPLSVAIIGGYVIWALILMIIVPGPRTEGPVTPKGNLPLYKDNGFSCYVITMISFAVLAWFLKCYTQYSVSIVYDHFDEILGTLTIYSHILCIFLYVKGAFFPSSSDSSLTGNVINDYYFGTELHPRVLGIDIKVFTNCRFGMTVWNLLIVIFTMKNYEMHGFVDSVWVSSILQSVYIAKFFWWEAGYMGTIDIMLDRAGYMICWGCLVFVPGLYTSVSLYLVSSSSQLGFFWSSLILSLGLGCCLVNYLADNQKQHVRRTKGNCEIWGRKPEVIQAEYILENGETKTSLLLVSGYWGISRHFHYIPELGLAFLWTLPSLFQHMMPYSYFIFLTMLLFHRTFRDDTKCSQKYQRHWKEYCQKVPFSIIPYIF